MRIASTHNGRDGLQRFGDAVAFTASSGWTVGWTVGWAGESDLVAGVFLFNRNPERVLFWKVLMALRSIISGMSESGDSISLH